jgi:transposase
MQILDLGADVDSRFIVIAGAARACAPLKLANERKAIAQWLRGVPRGSRLAMESTGGYHEVLAELAHKAGLQVFVINPRNLRRYAEGVGQRGKTDRTDAEVIARYVAHEHEQLHAYVAPNPAQRRLNSLMTRRAKLVSVKGAIAQSLRGLTSVKRQVNELLEHIDGLIRRLEMLMQRILEQMPAAHCAARHIQSVPGFGQLTSTYLAQSFTRLAYASSDAVVAAAGLDPRPADSGKKHGKRRLSKRGPAEERRLLFDCARSAARTKVWRPYYERQLAKGLSTTAAAVILARKMLRIAFALYKHDRDFDPSQLHGSTLQTP